MNPLHVNCWDEYQRAMDQATIKVAVDAGANDGGYTHTLRQNGFTVHAFEPVPHMFQKLSEKHRNDPMVFGNNLGLSDRNEIITGVTVTGVWTIARPDAPNLSVNPDNGGTLFDMRTVTLDGYLGDTRIGLFKLDVDGYEPKVLKGAEKTVLRDRPPILCELGHWIIKMGHDPRAFIEQIFALGYVISSMDGKCICRTWEEVHPQYPYDTTFDVMLFPK